SEDGADAQHELLRAERLREVVIGAERESANTIRLLDACREHQHTDALRWVGGPQLFQDVVPRKPGKHQVEDDERWVLTPGCFETIGPSGCCGNTVPRFREMIDDERD